MCKQVDVWIHFWESKVILKVKIDFGMFGTVLSNIRHGGSMEDIVYMTVFGLTTMVNIGRYSGYFRHNLCYNSATKRLEWRDFDSPPSTTLVWRLLTRADSNLKL